MRVRVRLNFFFFSRAGFGTFIPSYRDDAISFARVRLNFFFLAEQDLEHLYPLIEMMQYHLQQLMVHKARPEPPGGSQGHLVDC